MIFSRRFKILISALSLVALAIAIGLLYFVFNNSEQIEKFYFRDFSLLVGETKEIDYVITNPNADIKFSVEDESIARVDNTTITGLACGETKLNAVAICNGHSYFASCKVTIIDNNQDENVNDYTLTIKPVLNCDYADGVLYAREDEIYFTYEISNNSGNPVKSEDINVSASEGITIEIEFGVVKMIVSGFGSIEFAIKDTDVKFTIFVEKI